MVQFKNVSFSWKNGGRPILSGFSATFDNKTYAIMGQEGLGKSTILRLANGNLIPSEGEIISGSLVTADEPQFPPVRHKGSLLIVTHQARKAMKHADEIWVFATQYPLGRLFVLKNIKVVQPWLSTLAMRKYETTYLDLTQTLDEAKWINKKVRQMRKKRGEDYRRMQKSG